MSQLLVKTHGLTKKSKTGYRVHDLDMSLAGVFTVSSDPMVQGKAPHSKCF